MHPRRWLPSGLVLALLVALFAVVLVFWIALAVADCPRCGGDVFFASGFYNPFRKTCAHCGQRLARDEPGQGAR
jgi:ribosomal protein S27AE